MDPETCLKRIINALHNGEEEHARDLLEDLRSWIKKGGFSPKDAQWRKTINDLATEKGIIQRGEKYVSKRS